MATISLKFSCTSSGLFFPKTGLTSATPDIGVAKGKAVAATKAAVDLIGGIKSVVKKGHRVLIKPNVSFSRSPEEASNTHPDVAKEVLKAADAYAVAAFEWYGKKYKPTQVKHIWVTKKGGRFIDHVYVRRGRVYYQKSGETLMKESREVVKEKLNTWKTKVIQKESKI